MVLNHLEFICVAILTGAANEEIIKAQIKKAAYSRIQPITAIYRGSKEDH